MGSHVLSTSVNPIHQKSLTLEQFRGAELMITLSSDFGSPYPAAMRGVLLSKCDDRLVDISHTFERGNIRTTAFWLREILPYFPPAVHLVVVDPGVGTDRAILAIRVGEHAFVGPDNGVLYPVISTFTPEWEAFELTDAEADSSTFHGRDVFAPLAAEIATCGVARMEHISSLEARSTITELHFPDPVTTETHIHATVLAIDGFGNVITNVDGSTIADRFGETMTVNGSSLPIARSYAFVEEGQALATIGSHGNIEIAVNRGRADSVYGLTEGDTIEITR